jgi:hypothetical protein
MVWTLESKTKNIARKQIQHFNISLPSAIYLHGPMFTLTSLEVIDTSMGEFPSNQNFLSLKIMWKKEHETYIDLILLIPNNIAFLSKTTWVVCIYNLIIIKIDLNQSMYVWRKVVVCFVHHVEISQTMVPLVLLFVPLESPPWIGCIKLVS